MEVELINDDNNMKEVVSMEHIISDVCATHKNCSAEWNDYNLSNKLRLVLFSLKWWRAMWTKEKCKKKKKKNKMFHVVLNTRIN